MRNASTIRQKKITQRKCGTHPRTRGTNQMQFTRNHNSGRQQRPQILTTRSNSPDQPQFRTKFMSYCNCKPAPQTRRTPTKNDEEPYNVYYLQQNEGWRLTDIKHLNTKPLLFRIWRSPNHSPVLVKLELTAD